MQRFVIEFQVSYLKSKCNLSAFKTKVFNCFKSFDTMKLENDVSWSVGRFLKNDNPKRYDAVHSRNMKDNNP